MDLAKLDSPRRRFRKKRYGLPWFAFEGVLIAVVLLAWLVAELVAPTGDFFRLVGSAALLLFGGILYPLDRRRAWRQRQEDLEKAKAAIAQPLNARLMPDGRLVHFEPHFSAVWPAQNAVRAIDPARRAIRIVKPNVEDMAGEMFSDVWPFDLPIERAELREQTQTWLFGLTRRRPALSIWISSKDKGRNQRTATLPFRMEDRELALSWLGVLEQWMRDDQGKAAS